MDSRIGRGQISMPHYELLVLSVTVAHPAVLHGQSPCDGSYRECIGTNTIQRQMSLAGVGSPHLLTQYCYHFLPIFNATSEPFAHFQHPHLSSYTSTSQEPTAISIPIITSSTNTHPLSFRNSTHHAYSFPSTSRPPLEKQDSKHARPTWQSPRALATQPRGEEEAQDQGETQETHCGGDRGDEVSPLTCFVTATSERREEGRMKRNWLTP